MRLVRDGLLRLGDLLLVLLDMPLLALLVVVIRGGRTV